MPRTRGSCSLRAEMIAVSDVARWMGISESEVSARAAEIEGAREYCTLEEAGGILHCDPNYARTILKGRRLFHRDFVRKRSFVVTIERKKVVWRRSDVEKVAARLSLLRLGELEPQPEADYA